LETLEKGTEAILTSEGFAAWLKMLSKFHQYSFNNVILIMSQMPEATHVNSYDRWQQLGRQVARGEKAIKIFYPAFGYRKETDNQTGEERKVRYIRYFGIGNVFDVGQTDGEPLPEPPSVVENTGTSDTVTAINLKLSRFLADEGLVLETKDFPGNARGFWNPTKRQIVTRPSTTMSPFSVGRTRTLVHEAGHFLADHRGQVDRSDAESVAEGATYATFAHFGIDVGDQSFGYLAGWAKDMAVLRRNLGEIQKVSSALITSIEGVCDPFADGFGSFERSDPWVAVRDQLEAETLADSYAQL
jgi:antirestriction protein ArdC